MVAITGFPYQPRSAKRGGLGDQREPTGLGGCYCRETTFGKPTEDKAGSRGQGKVMNNEYRTPINE